MPDSKTGLLQGTLDLLILDTLSRGPAHGWGIAQHIQRTSKDVLEINQGSLYPALHRLEYKGWVSAHWGTSENNRRAKFYELTPAGRKHLSAENAAWLAFSSAVNHVLGSA